MFKKVVLSACFVMSGLGSVYAGQRIVLESDADLKNNVEVSFNSVSPSEIQIDVIPELSLRRASLDSIFGIIYRVAFGDDFEELSLLLDSNNQGQGLEVLDEFQLTPLLFGISLLGEHNVVVPQVCQIISFLIRRGADTQTILGNDRLLERVIHSEQLRLWIRKFIQERLDYLDAERSRQLREQNQTFSAHLSASSLNTQTVLEDNRANETHFFFEEDEVKLDRMMSILMELFQNEMRAVK